ncbi:MAG: RNB domain-containing ribonuclease [Deltaproteobacteria bacterium]|nr:RNB domain-containing ribonuclease [Deltaproteobacteria bacterium]
MSTNPNNRGISTLERIAGRVMTERGFLVEFSAAALNELEKIAHVEWGAKSPWKDLRHLLWASIDNDDSLDLDQLTVAEILPDKTVKIFIAVADVDAIVKKSSAIDEHARQNTTSVYTAGNVFPMLPEKLSTDLTSLNYHEDRPAVVIETVISDAGEVQRSDIYRALVRNFAKLAYNSVAAWLEGEGPMPEAVAAVPGLAENLRIQDRVAQQLKGLRHEHGALDLQTLEARPIIVEDEIQDLRVDEKNRAKELIEDFMIAANGATARFLHGKKIPSLMRMVRSPKRWDRIVEIAAQLNSKLPAEPDSRALASFLAARKTEETAPGHFGLAVKDYTHSTAPNRRFPDLATQRILKAALDGSPMPYSRDELVEVARHCTEKENDANKVERLVAKSAAAMLLSSRIGDQFDAMCTGAADKGTWVRIFHPPVEGRLLNGHEGVDVGDRLRVQLIHTDVEKGYIDFKKIH